MILAVEKALAGRTAVRPHVLLSSCAWGSKVVRTPISNSLIKISKGQ